MREFTWQPEDFGIARQSLDGLMIESPAESAVMIRKLLAGERGSARDIVVLNAAAGLLVAGREAKPQAAAERAGEAIDSGAAEELLGRLAARSHGAA
jgi:anthranilate phosphoribosyltransferase